MIFYTKLLYILYIYYHKTLNIFFSSICQQIVYPYTVIFKLIYKMLYYIKLILPKLNITE